MIGVNAKVVLERTLYLDLPNDATEEQVLELTGKEIILPTRVLDITKEILSKINVKVPKLDLSDWKTSDVKYEIIKDNNGQLPNNDELGTK